MSNRKGRPNPIKNSIKQRKSIAHCGSCQKYLYACKADAKRMIRGNPEKGLSAYECEYMPGWHIGHLPRVVQEGRITRSEYYGLTAYQHYLLRKEEKK